MTFDERLAALGVDLSDLPREWLTCVSEPYSGEQCYKAHGAAWAWYVGEDQRAVPELEQQETTRDRMILRQYILHLTDIIDRMEMRIVNLTGERDWLKKCMQQFQFGLVVCTEGGVVKGHEFRKGDIYPILGANNGIQICYENNEGDAAVLMCHTWDGLAPVCGDDDERFIDQDGTIPPLFEPLSRYSDGVPEDWSVDE